jgi:hypothetical protein
MHGCAERPGDGYVGYRYRCMHGCAERPGDGYVGLARVEAAVGGGSAHGSAQDRDRAIDARGEDILCELMETSRACIQSGHHLPLCIADLRR